jgi:hypothetical protein
MLKFKDRLRNRRIENSHAIAESAIDDLKERDILQRDREKRGTLSEREKRLISEREREGERGNLHGQKRFVFYSGSYRAETMGSVYYTAPFFFFIFFFFYIPKSSTGNKGKGKVALYS